MRLGTASGICQLTHAIIQIVQLLPKGGTRAGACKFLSATLGRPINLDQKLIALVGTGIISHPQPL